MRCNGAGIGVFGINGYLGRIFSLLGDQRKICAFGIDTTRKLLGQRSVFGLFVISFYC